MDFLFHLAFPVYDLEATRKWYEALGCRLGRSSPHALVIDLGGHQIVAHRTEQKTENPQGIYPRHFGLIFPKLSDWEQWQQRAREKSLVFFQEPKIRFAKTPLEHRTFFLQDPSHNLLEFKYYENNSAIFGAKEYGDVGDS